MTHFENLTRAFNDDFLYVSAALLHFCMAIGFAALGYVVYVPYKAWKDQIPN